MRPRTVLLVLSGMVVWLPLHAVAQNISFAEALIPAVGGAFTNPRGVAAGDLNRDGKVDLVTANSFDDSVSVLLGRQDGSFSSPSTYPAGEDPHQVAIGDLDGDGIRDLAVATSSEVAVLAGNGDGSFGAPRIYALGYVEFVGITDINRNGRGDLVTVSPGGDEIEILLGNSLAPPPSFIPGPVYQIDGFVSDAKLADVNRDGEPDLLVLTETNLIVAEAIPGGFSLRPPIASGGDELAVGDLNKDGDPDVAIADFFGNSVSVLLGASGTGFTAGATLAVEKPLDVAIADLNGDAGGDVVAIRDPLVGSEYRPVAEVFEGNGAGGFGAAQSFSLGITPIGESHTPVDLLLAHTDGDARIDIVTANSFGNTVSVLRNTTDLAPAGGFGTRVLVGSPEPGLRKLQVGDLNQDGKLDVVALDSKRMVTYLGNGDGSFLAVPLLSPSVTDGLLLRFELGDLNRDGRLDAVASYLADDVQGDDSAAVFMNLSGGSFDTPSLYEVGRNPVDVHLADVVRDGFLDILVTTPGDPSHDLSMLTGDFSIHRTFAGCAAHTNVVELALGDIDQDGKQDAVIGRGAGSPTIEILRGDGNAHFTCAFSETALGASPFFIGGLELADRDGDSDLDVSAVVHTYVNDPTTETRGYLWTGEGIGEGDPGLGAYRLYCPTTEDICPSGYELQFFVEELLRTEGSSPHADLDRDGRLDLLLPMDAKLFPVVEYEPAHILLLRGRPGGFNSDAAVMDFEISAKSPQVGDFNRDGRPDIITIDGDQIILLLNDSEAEAGLIEERGTLRAEIERLKEKVFRKKTLLYDPPSLQERSDFRALAQSVEDGELQDAVSRAAALDYEVVLFTDSRNEQTYVLLREKLDASGNQTHGWGNYVYDAAGGNNLIEAAHPLSDTRTPELSIDVFFESGAGGFLMAGAHRNTQDDQDHVGDVDTLANVAYHADSIFQVVHEEWSDADTLPLQVHGFDLDGHASFPPGTDAVISNSDGAVAQEHISLDDQFDDAGLLSFVYNTLSASHPVNETVNLDWLNGGVVRDGRTFDEVSGDYNVQSSYTRTTHGRPFLHVEFEQSVRFDDPTLWRLAIDAMLRGLRFSTLAPVAPLTESGALEVEVARLKSLILQRDSGLYVTPGAQDRFYFEAMAASLEDGDLIEAATWGSALDYEVVLFTDTGADDPVYLLREAATSAPGAAVSSTDPRGWGSYLYNPDGVNVLVEAPHPLFETNTPEIAYDVFVASNARGYLMAGAHRATQDNDIHGEANVVIHPESIFHVTHTQWSDDATLPIQIHGFSLANHAGFPSGTDVVLSNGDGTIPQVHDILDAEADDRGLLSFVYNTLPSGDPDNVAVNSDWENGGVADGSTFSPLAATLNVQGQHTRSTHGQPFAHVELEQSIRFRDPSLRPLAIGALVDAIEQYTNKPPDADEDGIPDDGDASGVVGDAPCTGGQTEGCDDNCLVTANPSQSDADGDGAGDACECGDESGDGELSTLDVGLLRQCVIQNRACTPLCDVSGDGSCSALDVGLLRLYVIGKVEKSSLSCAARPAP